MLALVSTWDISSSNRVKDCWGITPNLLKNVPVRRESTSNKLAICGLQVNWSQFNVKIKEGSYAEVLTISMLKQIRYRPSAPLVLRGISCTFEGGHKFGVVGRIGSGKTTLVGALFRLLEPAGGQIIVDGIETCVYSTVQLQSLNLMTYVKGASYLGCHSLNWWNLCLRIGCRCHRLFFFWVWEKVYHTLRLTR